MDMFLQICKQIGINQTAFIQFAIFILTIGFLRYVVFGPYTNAMGERKHRTKGGEDLAVEIHKKAGELHAEYELKAKEINSQIKEIYDHSRASAMKEYDSIVQNARNEANALIEKNRLELQNKIKATAEQLKSQTSAVALVITNKLLNK